MLIILFKRLRKRLEDIKGKIFIIYCLNKGDKFFFFIKLRVFILIMSGNGIVFKEKYELYVFYNYVFC